jgi:hypothetical protein
MADWPGIFAYNLAVRLAHRHNAEQQHGHKKAAPVETGAAREFITLLQEVNH